MFWILLILTLSSFSLHPKLCYPKSSRLTALMIDKYHHH